MATVSLETPRRRSYSQLDQYGKCGKAWQLQRLEKRPERPAAWSMQGTAVHHAVELWERSGRATDAVADCVSEYDRLIATASEVEPDLSRWMRGGRKSTDMDIAERRDRAAEQTAWYVQYAQGEPWNVWELPDGTPAVEVSLQATLGGTPVMAVVDAILEWPNGLLTVRDFKTGTQAPTPRQLGLYAVMARECLGIPVAEGDYLMMAKRSSSGFPDLSTYTKEYFDGLFSQLTAGIDAGVFLPNPGSHCFTCGVKDHCPEAA